MRFAAVLVIALSSLLLFLPPLNATTNQNQNTNMNADVETVGWETPGAPAKTPHQRPRTPPARKPTPAPMATAVPTVAVATKAPVATTTTTTQAPQGKETVPLRCPVLTCRTNKSAMVLLSSGGGAPCQFACVSSTQFRYKWRLGWRCGTCATAR